MYKWLPEKHRNLCAQVASNAPCHWYFDLDGKLSELQLNKVRGSACPLHPSLSVRVFMSWFASLSGFEKGGPPL